MFYSTQIEAESIWLSQEETNHCKNVLRIKIGENVQVTNGKGNLYDCKLTDYTKKGAQLHINNSNYYENNISKNLHIGIAPTKSADRIEWFVEKAVEIGIGKISLVMMQHSERKHISLERINKVAISAMKQSLQVYLPEIDVFNDIKSFIKTVENYPVKITAHLLQSLQNPINKVINKNTESVVVIGPEGDFSKDEIALMNQNNFEMCALGSTRLRTETAGVYVCAVVSGMG